MAPRSTKNRASASTRRFGKTADVRLIGSFRGALQPGFVERISGLWRFSGAKAWKPVRLNFRRPGTPFDLARRPRPRRTPAAHYVFSPTIQLTFPFNPISNLFFETDTHSSFQWLLSQMNALRPPPGAATTAPDGPTTFLGAATPPPGATTTLTGATMTLPGAAPATISPGGGFWLSLRQFRNYREGFGLVQVRGPLLLLKEGWLAGTLIPAAWPRSGGATSRAFARLVFTILHAPRRPTPTLKADATHSGIWPGQSEPPRVGRRRHTEKMLFLPRSVFAPGTVTLLRSVLAPGAAAWAGPPLQTSLRASGVVNLVAPRQTSRVQLTLFKSWAGPASPGGSFARPSLTFAAAKPSDAARPSQSFGPPAALSYAKRESPQLQAVVQMLRDLRLPQSEARPPAPPLSGAYG